jgi:hypothetical protein
VQKRKMNLMTAVCVCVLPELSFIWGVLPIIRQRKIMFSPSAALERSVDFIIIVSLYI